MPELPIRRALLSVSDKTGIVEFARGLLEFGVEILSTGGTARALSAAGIPIVEVGAFTGFPEILDGRVKTLHPRVHAGILYRRDDPSHAATMERHRLVPIDLVAVNLYPFEATVARGDVRPEEAIEEIDIGGPALLRSAAKNHAHVTVTCDAGRYEEILTAMRASGGRTPLALRQSLAAEVFDRTAAYDAAIARYLSRGAAGATNGAPCSALPERLEVRLDRSRTLRYGENPHQQAALYGPFLDRFEQLHGRELSYNNILDLSAALEVVEAIGGRGPAVAIVKHSNPCGAATGASVASAWQKALACDRVSASGGIIASSAEIDEEAARALSGHFIEVLVAPGYAPEAVAILREKKNRIILRLAGDRWGYGPGEFVLRSVPGGVMAQTADEARLGRDQLLVVTRRSPAQEELEAMFFGWDVVRFVKSNAIVFSRPDRIVAVGAGQMSRVDSVRIARGKAADASIDLRGAAVASDAFFPFPDGLLAAADAGATAVIQPGGSVRDEEVIAAADARGIAMAFTGFRHFRH